MTTLASILLNGVANVVIVELKAVNEFSDLFTAQCLNYLKATGLPICLLLHRTSDLQLRRQ
ncbi:MAG: GxxExxY protein [Planctomycetota bacterium]